MSDYPRAVEARVLSPGDVLVTSDGCRVRVVDWVLCGDRVQLRILPLNTVPGSRDDHHDPFSVPATTRFVRES